MHQNIKYKYTLFPLSKIEKYFVKKINLRKIEKDILEDI